RPRPPAAAADRYGAVASSPHRSAVASSRGLDPGPPQPRQGMKAMLLGRRHFTTRVLPLAAGMAATACSSPDPRYYSIVTRSGPVLPSGPKIVRVKDIGLASYLDRREVVRSSEGYRLEIMSNDWWGESLSSMLSRVLVLELSQRLPGSSVYGESGAINLD